jgi:class 3 adenylate cyclase
MHCGVALELVCGACGTALPPGSRFCDACGTALAATPPPTSPPPEARVDAGTRDLAHQVLRSRGALEGERKQVTVLFADIKGSTALIEEMDPEQAVQLMQPVLQAMMDAVHRFEGTVNRVQGDGIMALFGAPIAHEDHAARACHAALAIQSATEGTNGLPVRVGLNTGEVVVRSISNDLTVEYEADGPTVHLAARMEQMAEPGTIVLTPRTYALVQGIVRVQALGERAVKGMTAPVSVYRLLGVRSGRTRLEARPDEAFSPFVGRESEMAALERALLRAGDRRGQVVAISGEAGVGKSRLVHEFVKLARGKGWTVRITGGDPLAATSSYQPVIELLKSLFDIDDDDDRETMAVKMTGAVHALDPALAPIVTPLKALLGVPVDDPDWPALSPQERRTRTIDATCALTLARAGVLHLLMVFEDLHWVDAETQAVLDALVDGLAGARMVLLLSHRPDYRDTWAGKSYYTRLRVDPLEPLTADDFLRRTLGDHPSLEQLKQMLVERTQGVPFFLEESIRTLAETGQLTGEPGAYRTSGEFEALQVPESVQAVLAARIDRLQPVHKEVLQVAAVIGRTVPLSILGSVAAVSRADLDSAVAALQGAEFLFLTATSPEPVYAFTHALTRDVAYASLLREVRRGMHLRLVDVIEQRYAARLDEHLAVLGRHALDAEQWQKADGYLARAAEQATGRYAYGEAVRLRDQQLSALERLAEEPSVIERRFEVHLSLRSAHGAAGNVARMVEHLRAARTLAARMPGTLPTARVDLLAASVIDLYEDPDAMIATIRSARAVSAQTGDDVLAKLSRLSEGILCAFTGRFDEAVVTTAVPDGGGEQRHERFGMTGVWSVQMLILNAISKAHLGAFDDAAVSAREACSIADEAGHPYDEGLAFWTLGAVGLWSGRLEGTVEALTRGYEACAAKSVWILMPTLAPTLAYALCLHGRAEEGREVLGRWLAAEEGASAFWFHGWGAAFSGLAGVLLDEHDDALAALRRWRTLVSRHRLRGIEAEVELAYAQCRMAAGVDAPEVLEHDLRRALASAESVGAAAEAARCRLQLGRLALQRGDAEQGRTSVELAAQGFRELAMPMWESEAARLPRHRADG